MRLRILFIVLISTALAEQQKNPQRSARTPQGQIRYQDANGLKVNWKFFAHQNQQSEPEEPQRFQRDPSESLHPHQASQQQSQSQLVHADPYSKLPYTAYPQAPIQQQPDSNQPQYKVYPLPQPQPLENNQVQYKAYTQAQIHRPESSQAQYKPYVQSQIQNPESNQEQYKEYVQPEAPAQPKVESNQILYKGYQQIQAPAEAQPEINQIQYKSYSDVPAHLKQIVDDSLKPRVYVDQSAFIYPSSSDQPHQYEQQLASAELAHFEQPSGGYEVTEQQKSRRDYSDGRLQGKVVYRDEYEQREQQLAPQVEHVSVPIERIPLPPPQKLILDKNMPPEIQELLQFQSQLPYNVIANSITYKPKTLFLPKLLTPDSKGPYKYRSQVFYVNDNKYEPEFDATKPVQEDQRI